MNKVFYLKNLKIQIEKAKFQHSSLPFSDVPPFQVVQANNMTCI